MYQVILFYKYFDIENPHNEIVCQQNVCQKLGLVGRIILSEEGINGTLCGTIKACEEYENYLRVHPIFFDIDIKKSFSHFICFPKLIVKYKKEIVILQADADQFSFKDSAQTITAEELHKEIETNSDLVLFDMRNQYESRIGKFTNAICPALKTTREFLDYVKNNPLAFDNKDIVMYCTGGVRCERTSAIVKKLTSPKKLRHLKNGIHAYAERYPDGYFRGRNYVFDDRVSVKINEDVLTLCDLCGISVNLYNNCLNAICNKQYICCDNCLQVYKSCCSKNCIMLTELKKVPLRPCLKSRAYYYE